MDTRLPRSPVIKSPMFLSKSPMMSEKYKSGCAWGLVHFFDFRLGSKLVSDKKTANRLSKGKNLSSAGVGHSKGHRKATKSGRLLARGCDSAPERCRQVSDRNMVSNARNDVHNMCRKHDHQAEINVQVNMNEAVEAFVNQRLSNRSTDFIDALEILNSNKDLFMKILQDPNSLLVKHIKELREPQPRSQSQPMNTIVVLKAGRQNRISSSLNKKEKGISPTFKSSEHIERKSRHATRDDFKRIENGSNARNRTHRRTMHKVESLPVYEHGFASPQMRFSPYTTHNIDTNRRTDVENLEALHLYEDEKLDDGLHGMQNADTNQRTEAFDILQSYKNGDFQDSTSRKRTSYSAADVYSSSTLRIRRAEQPDSMIDEAKQSSSLSVLEQSFVEDDSCSPRTISLAAEPPIEPICVDIEELHESLLDKQGSLSKCIRSILQISGLNWDELSRKCHLSDQMLDSSVFDNVKVWPDDNSCFTDHRLLFGYIDEVLSEICQCYFRCSPWISLLEQRPRSALLSEDMVREVLKHVDWLLLSELPQRTLQQLADIDLAKSRTWMDIGLDAEEVVIELADDVLDDLVIDAAIQMQT